MPDELLPWRAVWRSRSSPSPQPSWREFAELDQAKAFLDLIKRGFPPGDLVVAQVEPAWLPRAIPRHLN
jgi:hypothetical protein